MASVKDALMTEMSPAVRQPHAKVTVVGAGQVGMAAAFSLMTQNVIADLALVDVNEEKLRGEAMDIVHGRAFIPACSVSASSDYAITAGSAVCVVTAGARQREGESRLNLVQRNVEIFKGIIPKLVQYSPNTILVIVSNPVDILAYVAWKLSGLPKHRVIGSGTMLDSSRFRFLLSQKLTVSPQCCHGYIIGEHGDTSVAVWSGVNIGGVRLVDVNPALGTGSDTDGFVGIHKQVVDSAYEIIKLKGYTSWAIGLMVSTLCNAVLKNQRNVYALSTLVKGLHGIKEEVYLSLPSVVGETGITHVLTLRLTESEESQLRKSASTLAKIIADIKF